MKLPIAEMHRTIQGEGAYTGTPMLFIRTAGCTVGKLSRDVADPLLPTGHKAWLCGTATGEAFHCDTDFSKRDEVELDTVLNDLREAHVCLTGGEPLMWLDAVLHLNHLCIQKDITLHVETSGTVPLTPRPGLWLTVSPKAGYFPFMVREAADEVKLLVTAKTKIEDLRSIVGHRTENIYLSPINPVNGAFDTASLQHAIALLREEPGWRLNTQCHKLWRVP